MEIKISYMKSLEEIKSEIKDGGYTNLHVISDFDRTLTYGSINGLKTPSIIALLRDGKHLSEGYAEKARYLFEKYHPIEINPKISLGEKKKAMAEWWRMHHKLMLDSNLHKSDLEDAVKSGQVKLREGVSEFLEILHKNKIPLIIFSSSGCGDEIPMYFKELGKDYSNIFYVTNQFNWDENGKAISVKEPVIHVMNKDETAINEIPEIYEVIKDRRNVLLLGDSLGDIGMANGNDYDNLIKVGLLNSNINKLEEIYLKNFDVVLEGDSNFDYINNLIKELN
jgi:5'-nucleotidase